MTAVLAYLGFAFLIVLGFFHPLHRRTKTREDFAPYVVYFGAFFVFFFLGPCLLLLLAGGESLSSLGRLGLTLGGMSRSLPLAGLGAPLAVLAGWIGSGDKAIRSFYPFSKEACRSAGTFVVFELAYVVLYYPAWEFLFRGILFFPFIPVIGLVPALGLETALSTLYHIGHPPSEILAAAGAGLLFGLVAFWTGSILVTALLHAVVGVSTDTFLYFRLYRGRAA